MEVDGIEAGKRSRRYQLRLSEEELAELHATAEREGLDLSAIVREIPRLLKSYEGNLADDLAAEHRDRVLRAAKNL